MFLSVLFTQSVALFMTILSINKDLGVFGYNLQGAMPHLFDRNCNSLNVIINLQIRKESVVANLGEQSNLFKIEVWWLILADIRVDLIGLWKVQ